MLGVIAIIAIQRAIQKIMIAVFLTREFKHDETNRAWWTGKWYGRGLGNSAMSQPAREFIVKVVEMSLWSSDFLLGHLLLIILTPPILIPYVNSLHSMMLCMSLFLYLSHLLVPDTWFFSLASTVETDSRPIVLDKTEETATVDSHQIHRGLRLHDLSSCLITRPA